jgi:hypothetical protein
VIKLDLAVGVDAPERFIDDERLRIEREGMGILGIGGEYDLGDHVAAQPPIGNHGHGDRCRLAELQAFQLVLDACGLDRFARVPGRGHIGGNQRNRASPCTQRNRFEDRHHRAGSRRGCTAP